MAPTGSHLLCLWCCTAKSSPEPLNSLTVSAPRAVMVIEREGSVTLSPMRIEVKLGNFHCELSRPKGWMDAWWGELDASPEIFDPLTCNVVGQEDRRGDASSTVQEYIIHICVSVKCTRVSDQLIEKNS